jgi:hypothetical protein
MFVPLAESRFYVSEFILIDHIEKPSRLGPQHNIRHSQQMPRNRGKRLVSSQVTFPQPEVSRRSYGLVRAKRIDRIGGSGAHRRERRGQQGEQQHGQGGY